MFFYGHPHSLNLYGVIDEIFERFMTYINLAEQYKEYNKKISQ